MKPCHRHPQWGPHLLLWTLLLLSLPFLSVQAENQEESSISMRHDPSAIELPDNKQIESLLPKDNLPATFYFYGSSIGSSVVIVNCPGREIMMYAKRGTISFEEWKHLEVQSVDEKTAEFASSSGGSASIDVPFWGSSGLTMVVVSVYFKETEDFKATEETSKQTTTFTILASKEIRDLSSGTPYEGSVYQDQYAFFRVNVNPDGVLLISLTSGGETDLFLGQNVRPTASNNRFALISKNTTKVIEIDKKDVDPISGIWVIGVYGNKDSSFMLTAVVEDQKIINLQPDTPFKMTLKESFSVNLKFLLESKRHGQMLFTKDSGEFDLYVNVISQDGDEASNIPKETNHKWKFSQATNFPSQCPLGWVSCLYLIHIEAKSSGEFSLLVNQEEKFLLIQDGFQYTGKLSPKESAAYMLNAEETQLSVDIEGTQLEIFVSHNPTINETNYLWKETLASKKIIQLKKSSEDPKAIWDSKKEVESNKNLFYILFFNPTNLTLDYSFPTAIRSSNTFHLNTEGITLDFPPYDKNSFLYYANKWETIEVNITLAVALEEAGENTQKALELALKQGQMIRAQSWTWKGFTGVGKEILFVPKSEPSASKNETHIILNYQLFLKETRPGKYMIEIANLWGVKLSIEISMNSLDLYGRPIQRMSQNFQYSVEMEPHFEKNFEILMTTPGNWYFWAYTCIPFTDLNIESNWEHKQVTVMPGNGSFYQETIENKPIEDRENRFKSVTLKSFSVRKEEQNRIYVYSVMVNETESPKDYSLEEYPPKWIKVSYEYQELKSEVIVKFNPLKFEEKVSTDKIRYEVRLFEGEARQLNCEARHNLWEKPPSGEIELPSDHKEPITLSLEALSNRKYSIDIRAFIIHKSQTIKFMTYPLGFVNTKNPLWENLFMVFIGIVACGLLVMVYKKWNKKKVGVKSIVEGEGDEKEALGNGNKKGEEDGNESVDVSHHDLRD